MMKLVEFLDLEISDAIQVIGTISPNLAEEWRAAYLDKHQIDLLNPQPFHIDVSVSVEILIPMVTMNAVPGRDMAESLGVLTASCVVGGNIVGGIESEITTVFGGRAAGYEHKLDNAGQVALSNLMKQAVGREADAVVGVRIDFGTTGATGGVLIASASGTAVKLKPSEAQLPLTKS